MRWALLVLLIAVMGTIYALYRPADPTALAQHLCEAAVERFAGYEFNPRDVADAYVSGNVLAGSVRLSFDAAGQRREAKCVFDGGTAKRVKLDGKVLYGS